MDQFSNETHPYQLREENNVYNSREDTARGDSQMSERNQRSRTVEANIKRDKKMYKMPMSKHISRHIYGNKDPNSNVFLK